MTIRGLLIAGLAGLFATAHAGPTGLNAMPIADIMRHREVLLTHSLTGTEQKLDKRFIHANALSVGLFDVAEVGFDNDYEGNSTWNLKIKFLEDEHTGRWALSGGYWNAEGHTSESYLVGRYDFRGYRLHLGWLHDNSDRLMIGTDFLLPMGFTGMAEHISGRGGYSWVGVYTPVPWVSGLGLTLSAGLPNSREDAAVYTGSLTWGFRF